jgi:hypothetical protein
VLASQEYHPTKASPTEEQTGSGRLLNTNVVTRGNVVATSSNNKMASGEGSDIDHACNETSLNDDHSLRIKPGGTAPAPAINRDDTKAKTGSGTPVHRQDFARAIGPKTRNSRNRSYAAFGSVDVKRRLIELWHQSLAKSEKSRGWSAFSNLNTGLSKKAAYTAETNH